MFASVLGVVVRVPEALRKDGHHYLRLSSPGFACIVNLAANMPCTRCSVSFFLLSESRLCRCETACGEQLLKPGDWERITGKEFVICTLLLQVCKNTSGPVLVTVAIWSDLLPLQT